MSGPLPAMPSCQGVWSSRDPVGGEHLDAFRDVAERALVEGVDPSRAVLALATSHGVLATAQGARWDELGPSDLLVVMDVDPVKGVMLLAGPGEASCWTGVLFLVMRHREEVNAALLVAPESHGAKAGHVRDEDLRSPLESTRSQGWGFEEGGLPTSTKRQGAMVEWASRALEGLKVDDGVEWDPGGSLMTGKRLDDLVPALKAIKSTRRPGNRPDKV